MTTLIRVTAYVLRFAYKLFRKVAARNLVNSGFKFLDFIDFSDVNATFLTSKEMQNSKLLWTYLYQQAYFSHEINRLKVQKQAPKHLVKLNPIVKDNFLLVGGRLDQSFLPHNQKHPYILPNDCFLTQLLIRHVHALTLHGGVQLCLATLRTQFWVLNGRKAVKKVIGECKVCIQYAAKTQNQLMGDLPRIRISPAPPFAHSGVDNAGPFAIRLTKSRGKGTLKGYVCLFVCLVTRGIHLELVEDYTAESFIAAFHRFTSRWGHCSELLSDQGTNFIGADAELRRMYRKNSTHIKQICPYLAVQGTQWKWNPPGAPHFGGIWESGVKSTKHHIRRVVGESVLTFSEMSTLLSRIGACLNSRPLLPLTDEVSDTNYLTPAHFLIQRKSYLVPENDYTQENISAGRRWQLVSQKVQHFWARWKKEYLTSLQPRSKWTKKGRSFQPEDVVFIRQENSPPGHWPLARVVHTYPDKHGLNRFCDVQTAQSQLQRPSVKLVLLVPAEEKPQALSYLDTSVSSLVLLQPKESS